MLRGFEAAEPPTDRDRVKRLDVTGREPAEIVDVDHGRRLGPVLVMTAAGACSNGICHRMRACLAGWVPSTLW
jgi:hypothetical protein